MAASRGHTHLARGVHRHTVPFQLLRESQLQFAVGCLIHFKQIQQLGVLEGCFFKYLGSSSVDFSQSFMLHLQKASVKTNLMSLLILDWVQPRVLLDPGIQVPSE